jgi:hypothetical protein
MVPLSITIHLRNAACSGPKQDSYTISGLMKSSVKGALRLVSLWHCGMVYLWIQAAVS